jgi:hypothetical protein
MDRVDPVSSLTPLEQTVLAVLAVAGETALTRDEVAGLAGADDVAGAIAELARRGFVAGEDDGRVRLSAAWHRVTAASDRARAILERAVDLAGRGRLAPETLLALTGWALRAGRYREALAIVRAAEGALAAIRRVEAWASLLERALAAARALGDREAEAWAQERLRAREQPRAEAAPRAGGASAPSRTPRLLAATLALAGAGAAGLAVGFVTSDEAVATPGDVVTTLVHTVTDRETETVVRTERETVTVPTTVVVTEPGPVVTRTETLTGPTTTETVTVPMTVTVTAPPPDQQQPPPPVP